MLRVAAVLRRCSLVSVALCVSLVAGCAGTAASNSSTPASGPISLSLGLSALAIPPDGTVAQVAATIVRPNGSQGSVSLAISGAPTGVTITTTQPLLGNYGALSIASAATTAAGTYPLIVSATDGTTTSTATLALTVNAADALTLTASAGTVLVLQDGTASSTTLTVQRVTGYSKAVTLSATGLPTGLNATYTQPGTGTSGTVTLTAATTPAAAGVYAVSISATDGTATTTLPVSVTVGVVATVANAINTSQGVAGIFQQAMSTGFQPSVYDDPFLVSFPSTTNLAALNSQHLRVQPGQTDTPWTANSSPQAATDWNFVPVDKTVQPLLGVGDKSPMFQVASAPSFLNDANGHFLFTTANLQLLASYAQNLVRYYNTGGFTWGGKHFQSVSSQHITWWAIFNEPNLNNVTAAQYVQIYNTLVPAMLSVDPTLQFVALELSDYTGQPAVYLPTLVAPAASGGLAAQINAVSTHFYGSCTQTTTDAAEFSKIPQFASDISYIRTELKARTDLANVPVWVTENNVNSDYQLTTGYSECTPTLLFVSDPRGTSGFFTAWRPYVFSQLGKAGNQALYHFLYEGSNQYGEVSSTTAATTLSYWTDYWLAHIFPVAGTAGGASLLKTTTTEPTATVEVLAVRNLDNSVSLMVTNFAVAGAADDNGAGAPRTVNVNLAALGAFSAGTQILINASTSPTTGPTPTAFTPGPVLPVVFTGYGTAFYLLKP